MDSLQTKRGKPLNVVFTLLFPPAHQQSVSVAFVIEPRWRRREGEGYGIRYIVTGLCLATVGMWIASIVKSFHFEEFDGSKALCQLTESPKYHFAPWCLQLFSSLVFIYLLKVSPHRPDYTVLPASKVRGIILLCVSFAFNLAFFLVVYFSKDSLTSVEVTSLSIASNFFLANQLVNEGPSIKLESHHSRKSSESAQGFKHNREMEKEKMWGSTQDEPHFEAVSPLSHEGGANLSQDETLKSQRSLVLRKFFPKNRLNSSLKTMTISDPIPHARSVSISTFPGL